MFELDRTVFSKLTIEEADNDAEYWNSLTFAERLAVAWELTCVTYHIDPENPPRFDKTFFKITKRD